MKLFRCQRCGQLLHFENTSCERCGLALGYLADEETLSALEPQDGAWRALARPERPYRCCENARYNACNWLVAAADDAVFCDACRHNRTVPDLSTPLNLTRWQRFEVAKHRLIYSLRKLRLPLPTLGQDAEGLAFDFLADPPDPAAPKVMTGHDNGLITINLIEADDGERERRRHAMGEPYRTLLGHFRHEVGHFYWNRMVRDGGRLEGCRGVFGDDRRDYGAALEAHYANGAAPDWRTRFVSAYASAHPWEDFAETWAHYLHICDTLEMANAYGLQIEPKPARGEGLAVRIDFDPHTGVPIQRLIDAWLPLTAAVDSLNRCMGQPDLYPFILTPSVITKLGYVHDLVHAR